ncbi:MULTISPECIES: DNA double-strand break repair nuclease NurA [unclassified Coleofasciculus]|uniref:DNA double-strand break repair nuclease NurA n=1 Tax=unclassified Coleofasciculus TaxID=2692782 RepID=UPI0018816C46|nr:MULTISPECIES: DNA double-strand break repair nuclease NurA [unclassified Coleofasciculus]MBE9124984.1 DNA double-strand break repair nuclease NurA [Coleofasciculus sp. LEGE 07081]MBE9148008.1 DNA double-strand break repair nuclease NurA [Coleofasciculus sp. LEGE 07092]
MLDLTKLAKQIPGISQHLRGEAAASRQRLELANRLLFQTQARCEELVAFQQQWRDRMIFTAATPVEPLDTRLDLNSPPDSHTVFATDGSQISPSHHEIAYCYLINVGRVMLHYGQSLHPLLDNLPEVFYRPEDLYVSRQWGIRTEEWMGYRRTASEVSMLAEMACRWVNPPGAHFGIPNLAMVDGSLIYWFLESLPTEARDRILPPILEAWEQLRAVNVPLMGYLSASRSGEALNFLRLQACPHEVPDCTTYCAHLTDKLPCQVIDPLRDALVWASLLQPGQRGPLFRSSARILDLYSEHRIYFCYVHVGTEIARVEVPEWVAQNSTLFDQALSLMLAQVYKGYGYPVALAEAHNQAVVRGGDRIRFFALLEQQMIRAGLRNVGTSYKEARKRGSIS